MPPSTYVKPEILFGSQPMQLLPPICKQGALVTVAAPAPTPAPAPAPSSWPFTFQAKLTPLDKFLASASATSQSQDCPTVNLSDLYDYHFPELSSGKDAKTNGQFGSSDGGSGPSEVPRSAQICENNDEFPSYPDIEPENLDSFDPADIQALLGQMEMLGDSGQGSELPGASGLNQVDAPSNPMGTNSTWMSYPNSIMSQLQNDSLAHIDISSLPVLEDLGDLSSMEDDRLMSIFSSSN